ncbi:MAG: PHP domain-containing protein [Chloroflexi bacterium]|nr:PHP domain-containing protein [Chloroflexota bacterium]
MISATDIRTAELYMERANALLKADLHVHSEYSMDCRMPLEQIIKKCQERGISCVAIADHGTAEGGLKMQKIAPFKVIAAEEILTPHGEIMGMFLQETIPSHISVDDALRQIKAQGGLVCIPHPFGTLRGSALRQEVIEEIVDQIDVIEVFNARAFVPWDAAKARNFALKHAIPGSAGSDSHTLPEIGNAYIEIADFNGKDGFLRVLKAGRVSGHLSSPLFRFNSVSARIRGKI